MPPNIPDVRYLACWVLDDGIYSSTPPRATPARVGDPGAGTSTGAWRMPCIASSPTAGASCGHVNPEYIDH